MMKKKIFAVLLLVALVLSLVPLPLTAQEVAPTGKPTAIELTSHRTEFSKTYYLGGDIYRLVTGNVINWKYDYSDPKEQWKEANPQWQGNTVINAPYTMSVDGNSITVTSRKTGGTVIMSLDSVGGIAVNPILGLSKVASGIAGVDVEITPYEDRVSFARVITDKTATTQAVYTIEQTGEGLYVGPDAKDANGKSLPVQYSVRDNTITEWIDEEDLKDAVYPITIDPTISPYSSTSDGRVLRAGNTYLAARDGATGTVTDGITSVTIGQQLTAGPIYQVIRGFFFFDTSAINATDTVLSSSLFLYGNTDVSVTDFDLVIQDGQPTYPHDPLEAGDYLYSHYTGDGGSFNTAGFSVVGYNEIALNAAGLDMITKGGTTKLCVKSSRDIASTAPTGDEYVAVYSTEEAGVAKDPYLTVDYSFMTVRTATSATASFSADKTLTIAKPVGTVEGDILIFGAGVYVRGNLPALTAPGGWTLITYFSTHNPHSWLYYKIATDSEPATYAWEFTQVGGGATNYAAAALECVIGGTFSIDDPIDTYSVTDYVVNNGAVRASMTTTYDNECVVFFALAANVAVTFTPPTVPDTFIEDTDGGVAGWMSVEAAHLGWTSHGATGNIDATASVATTLKHALAVALNPPIPSIQTLDATYVTNSTARLNSYLTSDDNGSDVWLRFQWDTDADVSDGHNTTWTGPYHTGQSYYENISGLSATTPYWFMVQARIGEITVNGTILSFTTAADPQPPTDPRIYTEDDRIVLAWTRGIGTSHTMVRWKLGDYPSSATDGTLLTTTEFGSASHDDLDYGTTYYYAIYECVGADYTAPIYAMITTGAGGDATAPPSASTPSLWFTTVDYTRYANMPLYTFINSFVNSLSSDLNFGWTIMGLLVSGLVGVFVLRKTRRAKPAVIALGAMLAFLVLFRLLPGFLAIFAVLFFIGASKMEGANAGGYSQ